MGIQGSVILPLLVLATSAAGAPPVKPSPTVTLTRGNATSEQTLKVEMLPGVETR